MLTAATARSNCTSLSHARRVDAQLAQQHYVRGRPAEADAADPAPLARDLAKRRASAARIAGSHATGGVGTWRDQRSATSHKLSRAVHPISYFQAVILGLVQGVAEPFPISSLGHGVVLPRLAGWNIHQNDKFFLTFLVATHLGTSLVLLGLFIKDWVRIVKGLWRSLAIREIREDDIYARMAWLLVAGTIPVGVIGLLLETPLRKLFASPQTGGGVPLVNGIALLAFERLRRRPPRPGDYLGDSDERVAKLSWRQAITVGTAQVAALIPGISRSGFSMGGGLLVGLSNEDAARFSFLLATPVILAAGALKLPELLGTEGNGVRGPALVGGLCAALTTFFAVKFLLRYFQTNRLTPFGVYCIGLGGLHARLRAHGVGRSRRRLRRARRELVFGPV